MASGVLSIFRGQAWAGGLVLLFACGSSSQTPEVKSNSVSGSAGAGGSSGENPGGTAGQSGNSGTGAIGGNSGTAGVGGNAGSSGSVSTEIMTCPERPGPCYPQSDLCGVDCDSKCQARQDYGNSANKRLRMSQLKMTLPSTLATPLMQKDILHSTMYFNSLECYQYGEKGGMFNWLLEVDVTTGKGRMGGAKPVADPDSGYCYVSEYYGSLKAEAVEFELTISTSPDGNYSVGTKSKIPQVVVPIYLDSEGMKSPFLLPLRGVSLTDCTLSEKGNCVGRFRGEADELSPSNECRNSPSANDANFFAWVNAGKLEGYISIEDADEALVVDVGNTSLCAFLTGHFQGEKCADDGFVEAKSQVDFDSDGDGVNDSFRFMADFAASAVRFSTESGDCN